MSRCGARAWHHRGRESPRWLHNERWRWQVFPATLTRDHGHIRRILIVALATLLLFATLVVIPGGTLTAFAAQEGSYTFTFVHTDGTKTTVPSSGMRAFSGSWNVYIPDAGGTSKVDPSGMTVHMSCSDSFADGWGSTGGPDPTVDSEWRVFSYYIVKAQGAPCGTPPPDPRLTLVKTVEGGGPLGVSDFPLFIDSVPAISGTAYTLEPGDYTASETTNADYAAGVWGGACAADGSVTLSAGDDVTCTITNTYQPPELATLTLVKPVEGGTLTADDFPVFLNGEPNRDRSLGYHLSTPRWCVYRVGDRARRSYDRGIRAVTATGRQR